MHASGDCIEAIPVAEFDGELSKVGNVVDSENREIPNGRWVVVLILAICQFTSYYALDNPAATHDSLQAYFYGDSQLMDFEYFFNLLYSAVAIPNIVFPFFIGLLSDRFGNGTMYPASVALVLVATSGVSAGLQIKSQPLVLASRTFYGIALEGVCLMGSSLTSIWLARTSENSGQVALAMATVNSMARLGSVVNNLISPRIAKATSVPDAFWFSVLLLVVVFLVSTAIYSLEKTRLKHQASRIFLQATSETPEHDSIIKRIRKFPLVFWIFTAECALFYAVFLGANNVASAFLVERQCGGFCCSTENDKTCDAQHAAEDSASYLMSFPFITCIIMNPFAGMIMDRFGCLGYAMLGALFVLAIAFLLLSIETLPVLPSLVLQGLAIGIYTAAAWPSIPRVISKDAVATAFGIVLCVQNIATTTYPLIIAFFRKKLGSYESVQWVYFVTVCITALLSFFKCVIDFKVENGRLNNRCN